MEKCEYFYCQETSFAPYSQKIVNPPPPETPGTQESKYLYH